MEHVTEEQFKKYFELKNNYEKNHISLTKEEIEFVNKVNEHVVNCFSCTTHFKQMEEQEKKKQEVEPIKTLDLNDFEEPAPVLPQENDDDSYDLQKELEAKFDELFGPIDDN